MCDIGQAQRMRPTDRFCPAGASGCLPASLSLPQVAVTLPDVKGRQQILDLYLTGKPVDANVDTGGLGAGCWWGVGAARRRVGQAGAAALWGVCTLRCCWPGS